MKFTQFSLKLKNHKIQYNLSEEDNAQIDISFFYCYIKYLMTENMRFQNNSKKIARNYLWRRFIY